MARRRGSSRETAKTTVAADFGAAVPLLGTASASAVGGVTFKTAVVVEPAAARPRQLLGKPLAA